MPQPKLKESDLSPPLEEYLTLQGYTVRCEVNHCDIIACKDDSLIGIELKKSMNLSLLIQCNERLRTCDSVYAALPEPNGWQYDKKWRKIQRILKKLEIGLIFINIKRKDPVTIVFHPREYTPRKNKKGKRIILEEISRRTVNLNNGGISKTAIVTAYRENAVQIALYLQERGPSTPRELRKLGTGDKTQSILHNNFYGWYRKVERGVYELGEGGEQAIREYPDLIKHYSKKYCERSLNDE